MVIRPLPLLLAVALAGCARLPVPKPAPYQASDADVSVTRIVHASAIVALRRTQVIVDPWFLGGGAYHQTEPLGLVPDGLPPLDAVLLTDARTDHFDETSVRALTGTTPAVIVPAALEPRVAGLGFRRVVALTPWAETTLGDVTVTAVPHNDTDGGCGYLLRRGDTRVWIAGALRDDPTLADLPARLQPLDVALLPIGGRSTFGVGGELGPGPAASFAARLGAQRTIPYHYGAGGGAPLIWYAGNPVESFVPLAAKAGLKGTRVIVLKPGDGWHYSR